MAKTPSAETGEINAIIIYWSAGGNTEKVAQAIVQGLKESGSNVTLVRTEDAQNVDFFAYDLVCVGFPSYQWHPPEPVVGFLKDRFRTYRKQQRIKVGAPSVPGKNALIFCTYSGQHTGINEALPAGKYVGQFFEHLGFDVLDEWYIVGQFHGSKEANTRGRMGDIRGRPNNHDLAQVQRDASLLANRLRPRSLQ